MEFVRSGTTKFDITNISVKETTQGEWFNVVEADEVFRENNSIVINAIIEAETMPTSTDIINELDSTVIGQYTLDPIEPYVLVNTGLPDFNQLDFLAGDFK